MKSKLSWGDNASIKVSPQTYELLASMEEDVMNLTETQPCNLIPKEIIDVPAALLHVEEVEKVNVGDSCKKPAKTATKTVKCPQCNGLKTYLSHHLMQVHKRSAESAAAAVSQFGLKNSKWKM